jgi:hypothetical protein
MDIQRPAGRHRTSTENGPAAGRLHASQLLPLVHLKEARQVRNWPHQRFPHLGVRFWAKAVMPSIMSTLTIRSSIAEDSSITVMAYGLLIGMRRVPVSNVSTSVTGGLMKRLYRKK